MVNVTVRVIGDPTRELALSYAPPDRRAALRALFALDAALGQVLRTTREPMVGQMRLAWWREALVRLDGAPPPGEPVLQALAADALPLGVTGLALSRLTDGWEQLLRDPIDVFALQRHAVLRGAGLFALGARICDARMERHIDMAARGWAFADLAAHLSDPVLAEKARTMASIRLPFVGRRFRPRWSVRSRSLGAMALIARMELAGPATSWRISRLAWHRLTGR